MMSEIPSAGDELGALLIKLQRWADGEFTTIDANKFVEQAALKIKEACWCDEDVETCAAHRIE